jgi:hypothetical protein
MVVERELAMRLTAAQIAALRSEIEVAKQTAAPSATAADVVAVIMDLARQRGYSARGGS